MSDSAAASFGQLRPPTVPQALLRGSKFLRWEEESASPRTVTLRVDANAHLLHWRRANGTAEYLEISSVRDTRTGRSAKIPRDWRMKENWSSIGGSDGRLEDLTVTIVYGCDLVNVQWMNFVAVSRETARDWTHHLFQLATHTRVRNPCFRDLLQRTWTKLMVSADSEGRILLKSISRHLPSNKEYRRRLEQALTACKLLSPKGDFVDSKIFTFDAFLRLFCSLCPRADVDEICYELNPDCRGTGPACITVQHFVHLLNKVQRDPRLNEILHPFANEAKARELLLKFETDEKMLEQGKMGSHALHSFLISSENCVLPAEALQLSQDMHQPLSHYFINSSHNTYLTGHQLTGRSSAELYRQVLLTGCRCVELDCWDGKGADEEPVVTHGYTMCTEVSFRETMEAIADSAFKVSEFPVILSFENRCKQPRQRAKMQHIIRECLGDRVLTQPLESHPLQAAVALPSPHSLRGKFLIKDKRRSCKKTAAKQRDSGSSDRRHSAESCEAEAEEASEEAEECRGERRMTGGSALDGMVNYVQAAQFSSFAEALKKNVSYECCSISETDATNLLKESPVEFVNFNKRQLTRIYPKGTRVDSSNFNPQLFWNAGCQLVALNFQTPDLGLQLNLGVFQRQQRCGFLLKPPFMRTADRRFDPFAEATVDGIVASALSVTIVSGFFLSERRVGTYVEAEMYGLPADCVRKRFRTPTVPANGLNPAYCHEPFVFRKVVLPQLATLRLVAFEESGRCIGQQLLPVEWLRPGYRHVQLNNELMQPLQLASLFVRICVSDYVSDAFADFAAALANPIQHLNDMEKHQQQLQILTEDFEIKEADCDQMRRSASQSELRAASHSELRAASQSELRAASQSDLRAASQSELRAASQSELRRQSAAYSGSQSELWTDASPLSHFGRHASATNQRIPESVPLVQLSVAQVLADKKYQKLLQKCSRELATLQKRNLKELATLRQRTAAPKRPLGSRRRVLTIKLRRHSSEENLRQASGHSCTQEQQRQLRLAARSHASCEYELLKRQKLQQQSELLRALRAEAASAEKQLESQYQQRVASAKKAQQRQRSEEARELARRLHDKAELREQRREQKLKQISSAVAHLQQLDAQYQRRLRGLQLSCAAVRDQLHQLFADELTQLQADWLRRLQEIDSSATSGAAGDLQAAAAAATASAAAASDVSQPGTPLKRLL